MKERDFKTIKDLPSAHVLSSGTPVCAGCGALESIKIFCNILGEKTVFVNAAGCMSLLTVYPFTPFRGSWIYTAMASAPAGAQGIRDAMDILIRKGRISSEEDLKVIVLTGDGSANGIGLSAASSAIYRKLDFTYICYDNEGYGNTGYQFSASTPYAARTATSKGIGGYQGYKKDLFSIWTAHHPAYAATVIGTEPLDLARKIEKTKNIKGPKLFISLSPCPAGWHFEPAETIQIGKLAVKTGAWPLKEYIDGKVVHTSIPLPRGKRPPVEEYLKRQGRFIHLFSPTRNEKVLEKIQAKVDDYWENIAED